VEGGGSVPQRKRIPKGKHRKGLRSKKGGRGGVPEKEVSRGKKLQAKEARPRPGKKGLHPEKQRKKKGGWVEELKASENCELRTDCRGTKSLKGRRMRLKKSTLQR